MSVTDWYGAAWEQAWVAARDLVRRLDEDNPLPVLDRGFLRSHDEALHVDVAAHGWWYGSVDVEHEHRELVDISGLGIFALTVAASTVGNRRARHAAWAMAAPQWRSFGPPPQRVLLSDQRLILDADGEAISLWLSDGLQWHLDLWPCWLSVLPPGGSPHALQGPWVPYLAVALAFALSGQVLALDSSAELAAAVR